MSVVRSNASSTCTPNGSTSATSTGSASSSPTDRFGCPGPGVRGTDFGDLMRASVILYDGVPGTKHVTTNVIVDHDEANDPTHATARSYFTVFQAVVGHPMSPVVGGRYHDTFECHEGVWRFTERSVLLDLFGELSRHLHRPPSP